MNLCCKISSQLIIILSTIFDYHKSFISSTRSIQFQRLSIMDSSFGTATRFAHIYSINTPKMTRSTRKIWNCVPDAINVSCALVHFPFTSKPRTYRRIKSIQFTIRIIFWTHFCHPIHFWWAKIWRLPIFVQLLWYFHSKSMHRWSPISIVTFSLGSSAFDKQYRSLMKWM